jgi:hypothetical protein
VQETEMIFLEQAATRTARDLWFAPPTREIGAKKVATRKVGMSEDSGSSR